MYEYPCTFSRVYKYTTLILFTLLLRNHTEYMHWYVRVPIPTEGLYIPVVVSAHVGEETIEVQTAKCVLGGGGRGANCGDSVDPCIGGQ